MSSDMAGLFVAFIMAVSMIMYVRIRIPQVRFMLAFTWFIPIAYLLANPPASIPAGSTTMQITIAVFIGLAVILMIAPFWYSNGDESQGRLRLPFMKTDGEEDEDEKLKYSPSRQERNRAYANRANNAFRGRR